MFIKVFCQFVCILTCFQTINCVTLKRPLSRSSSSLKNVVGDSSSSTTQTYFASNSISRNPSSLSGTGNSDVKSKEAIKYAKKASTLLAVSGVKQFGMGILSQASHSTIGKLTSTKLKSKAILTKVKLMNKNLPSEKRKEKSKCYIQKANSIKQESKQVGHELKECHSGIACIQLGEAFAFHKISKDPIQAKDAYSNLHKPTLEGNIENLKVNIKKIHKASWSESKNSIKAAKPSFKKIAEEEKSPS